MKFAYADPPYVGQARKHYGPDAREVNHGLLIAHLAEFDGWALSASSPSLRDLLPLCPGARVGAWVKPFAIFKPGVNPSYSWEPVLFSPLPRKRERSEPTVRDFVSANVTLRRGVHGAKPEAFCYWLFGLVGLRPEDEFVDLFPGSGAVMRAWEKWRGDTAPADSLWEATT